VEDIEGSGIAASITRQSGGATSLPAYGVLTRRQEFQDMPSLRRFHSIAALCGDGLQPELQSLFERLAVDPHSELFVRPDGMVQSGPDPVSAEASFTPNEGEPGTANADSTRHFVSRRKIQARS
jgi:hypothetical protein